MTEGGASLPMLYSFRRCPYAMRARMALLSSKTPVELREVSLRNKPDAMVAASPKATVPVLIAPDGRVVDESLTIMRWALERNDPDGWLDFGPNEAELLATCDGQFKRNLDRYKYASRYESEDPLQRREQGYVYLRRLDSALADRPYLAGSHPTLIDHAIFPFVRQFANHDRQWFDALHLPRLHPWLADLLKSTLFKKAMRKFALWQPDNEPICLDVRAKA